MRGGVDRYKYTMNPCGTVGGYCAGVLNEPMVCQTNAQGTGMEAVISYIGAAKAPPAWDLIENGNPGKGVRLTLRNGDFCWDGPGNVRVRTMRFAYLGRTALD